MADDRRRQLMTNVAVIVVLAAKNYGYVGIMCPLFSLRDGEAVFQQ